MKKYCMMGLALTLALCLMMSSALAVDANVLRPTEEQLHDGSYLWLESVVAVGDAGYFLGTSMQEFTDAQIHRWTPGMKETETYVESLFYVGNIDNLEWAQQYMEAEEIDADLEHGVTMIFSDGERLLAFNHLNGKVFAITAENGKAAFEDVTTIKDVSVMRRSEEDYSYYLRPTSLACTGDKLLYVSNYWDSEKSESVRFMLCIDLKDGSVKKASLEHPYDVTAFKDGKALVLDRVENAYDEARETYLPWDVLLYDPAADKAEKVAELNYTEGYWHPSYFVYSQALDALVYNHDTRVMGLFNNFKDEKQAGYLPISYANAAAILGDSIVAAGSSDSGVIIRTLSANFKTDEYINVLNGYMDNATRAFANDYPQIPVYSVRMYNEDAKSVDQLMRAGADAPDIMEMEVYRSVFTKLMSKKGCVDLSGYPKIKAYVDALYEPYRQAVTGENGEIYGVPLYANSYDGFYINKKVMNDMGLTVEDVPTNLVDLCAFVTRWNEEFVDEYPDYSVLEVGKYKNYMFNLMFYRYIGYCQATGTPVKFDTPVFRELMTALEAMKYDAIEESLKNPNPEVSDYKQGLIWSNAYLVGGWSDYTSENSDRIFIPMGLTKDVGFYTGVELDVLFINALSDPSHRENAVRLLEYKIDQLYDRYAYVLRADKTEPIENEYYAEWLENEQANIAAMEKLLAEAPEEEKADWQATLEEERNYFKRYDEEMRWDIHPKAITTYREDILPHVYVAQPSFMDAGDGSATDSFNNLINQYRDGKIDLNRFIKEADGKLMMMQSE